MVRAQESNAVSQPLLPCVRVSSALTPLRSVMARAQESNAASRRLIPCVRVYYITIFYGSKIFCPGYIKSVSDMWFRLQISSILSVVP